MCTYINVPCLYADYLYNTASEDAMMTLETQDALDSWHPMKDDFTSLRNSYRVDIDDPGVAIMGYSKSSNNQ